jgi:hypothetical protein
MKVGFSIPNNQSVEDPNNLVALVVTAGRSVRPRVSRIG